MRFFSKKKTYRNSLLKKIHEDENTRLRLKYDLWYKVFDKQVGNKVWADGREYLMLSSNDYLGLGFDPRVLEASTAAMKEWGASPTGSRLSNGSRRYHIELEEKLADFLGKEACHISVAGYISCVSGVSGFVEKGDVILVDRNVHSSLWDGARLSMAKLEKFSHNKPDDLLEVLQYVDEQRKKMLLIEGVYSMEGHVAPLDRFAAIAEEKDLFVVLDDAHGFGVMGQGHGTAHHFGVTEGVDVICGSFSKALSSTGGFVAGDRATIEFLRTYSKQTIFSAALSPGQAAAASAALDILKSEPEHVERLWANTRRFHQLLEDLGLDSWGSETPAVPIVIGGKEKCYMFKKRLLDKGVYANMIIPPGVPPGKDLIRTAISASFTDSDMDLIEEAVTYAAKIL